MLDHVSISHQSGVVLWSHSYTPTFTALSQSPTSPVNTLIREAFIESKSRSETETFEKDGYSVRWTMENGLGLVFVVVFPALLPLTYIPALLQRAKQLFLALFTPYIQPLIAAMQATSTSLSETADSALQVLRRKIAEERWDKIFDRCLRSCEDSTNNAGGRKAPRTPGGLRREAQLNAAASEASSPGLSEAENTPLTAEEISKNVQALKTRIKGRGRAGKGGTPSPSSSPARKGQSGAAAKLMRKWGDQPVNKEEMEALDYSAPPPPTSPGINGSSGDGGEAAAEVDVEALVSKDAMGKRGKDGLYEVAEWDFGRGASSSPAAGGADGLPSEEEILARGTSRLTIHDDGDAVMTEEEGNAAASGRWAGMLARLTGTKTLTKEDLAPVLVEMERHLMGKNVAKDIAEKLCEGVGAALVGKKLGGLTSVKTEVQSALSSSLTRVLTPKTSTDILLDIQRKLSSPSSLSDPNAPPDPYAITFVGVNGVGKSTNLSKVAFWLLQNRMRVLIAACDTFRSGAVEQLRVHVRNLGALGGEGKRVELYERGYGKDAAGIARDAIAYAKENRFDVVLIDTAGRMQDNEPLMRALAKLVTVNNPDKIIFVGEALVGNEAVDQLTKFDRSLRDFSGAGVGGAMRKRGIDGILLTKFDTIDDKVGAALSMTYVTGQPILFVGCGQTYTDLRHLRVNHIVEALLSS